MDIEKYIEAICAFIGACVGYFFGEFDGFLHALLVFVISDYISGVVAAYIKHELSSSVGFNGILRKAMIFIAVGVCQITDRELLIHIDIFKGTELLRDAVICFYLANEALSIFENIIDCGVPMPGFVKERFLMFHNKHGKNDEKSGVKD